MSCAEKMDADCVIYNLGNPAGASSLHNLNLPNGTSIRSILERIDQLFAISNTQADAQSYTAAVTALGTTSNNIYNTVDLLVEIANQIKTVKQSVSNLQTYTQNQLTGLGKSISDTNNPAVAAGPLDINDTLTQALEKLGNAVHTVLQAIPRISSAEDNQLVTADDGGLYVRSYSLPLSAESGNALCLKPDGFYVNETANGMNNEQLMEMLVNTGLNAAPNSTLSIKIRQLFTSYQSQPEPGHE